MKHRAATALAVLIVVMSSGLAAGAGAEFNATSTDTVVIAVGESPAALLSASAVANTNDFTVVRAPSDGLTPQTRQTLAERQKHGDLRYAIVVGSNISAVKEDILDLGLTISDQIEADSSGQILHQSSTRFWSSSDIAFVTGNNTTDYRKVAVAETGVGGAPVLQSTAPETDLKSALNTLGVSTVYVTPSVSEATRQELNESYTVDTAPAGVNLNQSLQAVAGGYATDTNDVAVVRPRNVLTVSQVGAGTNSSLLVASESEIGSSARTNLESLSNGSNVYVLGGGVDTEAVREATPGDVREVRGHLDLRTSLLVNGYQYGVLVSEVDRPAEETYRVTVTNIGFSTLKPEGGLPISLIWRGEIGSADPAFNQTGERYVISRESPMSPGEAWTVQLNDADKISRSGHPKLEYNPGSRSSGFVESSDVDLELPMDDNQDTLLVVGMIAALSVLGAAFVTNTWSTATGRGDGFYGASLGLPVAMEVVLRLLAIGIGIILAIPSDPITDTGGLILLAIVFFEAGLGLRGNLFK